MAASHILVVAVDGLRASALGAYGNTAFPTPALDQLAADSLVLDWCYAPSSDLAAIYGAQWLGMHPARDATAGEIDSLPRRLASLGYSTTLVSDEPALAALSPSSDFDERMEVDQGGVISRAEEVSQTSLARLFAAACEVIGSTRSDRPRLVWLHARGMYGPWDAPLELQRLLLEEGDPPPVEEVAPPDFAVAEGGDPDAAFRYGCAYAAQVMVLDECVKALLEALDLADVERWLVMLLGVRGFPLGEHRRVGGVDPRLYGEQLHVPWLVRFADGRGRLARCGQLVSHPDVLPTVVEAVGGKQGAGSGERGVQSACGGMSIVPLLHSSRLAWREAIVAVSGAGHRAIRTSEWCLRQDAAAGKPAELYVRPDDRWETNDVATLCRDVVEGLAARLAEER